MRNIIHLLGQAGLISLCLVRTVNVKHPFVPCSVCSRLLTDNPLSPGWWQPGSVLRSPRAGPVPSETSETVWTCFPSFPLLNIYGKLNTSRGRKKHCLKKKKKRVSHLPGSSSRYTSRQFEWLGVTDASGSLQIGQMLSQMQ